MTTTSAFLDIYGGDRTQYERDLTSYQLCSSLLSKHAEVFGLPEQPELLNEEQKEILLDLHVVSRPSVLPGQIPLNYTLEILRNPPV
jgi:hypothetical protein